MKRHAPSASYRSLSEVEIEYLQAIESRVSSQIPRSHGGAILPELITAIMPSLETVNAHVEAVQEFYTEDSSMRENQDEPRVGRDLHIANQRRFLSRLKWLTSLYFWKDSAADFADCLIEARNRRLGCRATATFDGRALKLPVLFRSDMHGFHRRQAQ